MQGHRSSTTYSGQFSLQTMCALIERRKLCRTVVAGLWGKVYKVDTLHLERLEHKHTSRYQPYPTPKLVEDRYVALKQSYEGIDIQKAKNAEGKLLKEGSTLAKLSHPNVVKVLGVYHGNEGTFMAMPFYPHTLSFLIEGQVISGDGNTGQVLVSVMQDIVNGMQYLICDQGLMHGDLHSGNVLLDRNLKAVIADFGMVTAVDAPPKYIKSNNNLIGKIAPELISGQDGMTCASETFALGRVMLCTICGSTKLPTWKLEDNIYIDLARSLEFQDAAKKNRLLTHATDLGRLIPWFEFAKTCTGLYKRTRPEPSDWVKNIESLKQKPTVEKHTDSSSMEYVPPQPWVATTETWCMIL
ncbi:protein kinase family protein [Parendozoicomonas haliclonae]|uniref:Serine/threonine-protein kinase n=1 Tax=Parendozoicomonas haliclonae TaxID=1960125 RepID=A0A1X7AQ02_9GAMM|nr:protein kinase family protein [Parendozoicomonas haliclonae]SMA50202.1 serine/threonine-protein kinase [Parendozoicomonas haliclonae]